MIQPATAALLIFLAAAPSALADDSAAMAFARSDPLIRIYTRSIRDGITQIERVADSVSLTAKLGAR